MWATTSPSGARRCNRTTFPPPPPTTCPVGARQSSRFSRRRNDGRDKERFAMGRSWYHWGHEPCWVVRRAGAKVPFLGERNQSTVWRAPSPKMGLAGSEDTKADHPTQKAVVLFERPCLLYTSDAADDLL